MEEADFQEVEPQSVVLRPKRTGWFGLLALSVVWPAIMMILIGFQHQKDPVGEPLPNPVSYLYFFLLFGAVPLAFLAWSSIAYIRLDGSGITCRTGLKTITCRWVEVTDYYFDSRTSDTHPCLKIVTTVGILSIPSAQWNTTQAKHYVMQHAANARATSWQELGTRADIDWPMRLGYASPQHRTAIRIFPPVSWISLAALVAFFIEIPLHQYANDGPQIIWIDLVEDSMVLIVPLSYIYAFLSISKELKARQKEFITVSDAGLSYENDASTFSATWREVTDLNPSGIGRKRAFVERWTLNMPNGMISFTHQIDKARTLKHIIEERCKQNLT